MTLSHISYYDVKSMHSAKMNVLDQIISVIMIYFDKRHNPSFSRLYSEHYCKCLMIEVSVPVMDSL